MENVLKLNCQLIEKFAPITGTSANGTPYIKADFVCETIEQYPKLICFTAWTKCVGILNYLNDTAGGTQEGDRITVYFNATSQKVGDRWFHNLTAWRIDKYKEPEQEQPVPKQIPEQIPEEMLQQQPGNLPGQMLY